MVHQETGPRLVSNTELLSFSEDSLGKPIADFLEGRERPQWIFEQDLDRPYPVRLCLSQGEVNRLREAGITRVFDLLSKTREDLLGIKGIGGYHATSIERGVGSFFDWLKVAPEMKLLGAVFGFNLEEEQLFLSPETETELREDVIEVLSQIEEDEALILTLKFGLGDWKQRRYKEVGIEMGISGREVVLGSQNASKKLRHPSWSGKTLKHRRLQDYFPSSLEESHPYLFD
jgi:hypothetical protein